ncbi:MAG: hypothetical protein ABSH26_03735 [Opitutaceae bacterium]|jgi:hypothetical protein
MPRRNSPGSAIRVIRFTRLVARQCATGDPRLAERAVCDAIANGSRRPTGRRGAGGGPVIVFERTLALIPGGKAPSGRRGATVAVLGELARGACTALRLLRPAPGGARIWTDAGFLNRASSK